MRLLYSEVTIYANNSRAQEAGRTFYLPVNTNYTIKIKNTFSQSLEYGIYIDGRYVGLLRVKPSQSLMLERPVHKKECFFFADSNRIPELRGKDSVGKMVIDEWVCAEEDYDEPDGRSNLQCDGPVRGGTVLVGVSDQQFASCSPCRKTHVARFFMNMECQQPAFSYTLI